MKGSLKTMASKRGKISTILAASVGGTSAFLFTQLYFSLWIKPSVTAAKDVRPLAPPLADAVEAKPTPATTGVGPNNGLRVSNRTPYPVRVVLRPHRVWAASLGPSSSNTKNSLEDSVHWDFAPEEGRESGLSVSIPHSRLSLQSGDLLMAFALDGSRRYWGPYLVGQTPIPSRAVSHAEWQLVLNP